MHFIFYWIQTYFATIKASTSDGVTKVSSNGITILPVGDSLDDVSIFDGVPCTQTGICESNPLFIYVYV